MNRIIYLLSLFSFFVFFLIPDAVQLEGISLAFLYHNSVAVGFLEKNLKFTTEASNYLQKCRRSKQRQ